MTFKYNPKVDDPIWEGYGMNEYRWIKLDNGRSVYRKDPDTRGPASSLGAPMLISDHMPDTWHPHDGKHYDSKSHFRAVTKASGGEEIGTDRQTATKHVDMTVKHDVGEAVKKLREGYKPKPQKQAKEGWS